MGVVDSGWWSVWWPPMLLWAVTLSCAVACVLVLGSHRRRARAARHHHIGMCLYLHERSVMDLYRVENYGAALRQEVEHRIRKDATLRTSLYDVAGAGVGRGEEVFRRYVEEAEPITVIGTIMDALKKANAIVYADLRNRSVTDDQAFRKGVAVMHGGDAPVPAFVRLRDFGDFVSVSGRFRKAGDTGTETVFLAPYGDPAEPGEGPQVRVVCATDGLRAGTVPDGTFQVRCLGKVLDWNPRTRELGIEPLAIFR